MPVNAGSANIDITANTAPYLAGMAKAKQATEDFVKYTRTGWGAATSTLTVLTGATVAATGALTKLNTPLVRSIAAFTALSAGIGFVTAQLKDMTTTGDTATEKLQRGLIEVSGQAAFMSISLAGYTSAFLTSIRTISAVVSVHAAAAAGVIYGLRSLTSSIVEQYRAIQEAKEEAREYQEQLQALSGVARGLRGVTGGVLTPFALQHGTGGDIRPEALAAATDLLPEITERMGDASRASEALATALRDPTQAFEALRLAGITFSEDQREFFRNVDTVSERLEAQTMIIRELQAQLFLPEQAKSGWQQFSYAVADLADRFLNMRSPLQIFKEWIDSIYTGFKRWFEFQSLFSWLDAQFVSMATSLQELNKYLFPRAGLESVQAYEEQIQGLQNELQRLRDNVSNAGNAVTRAWHQAFLTLAEETIPEAVQRIRNSSDYIKHEIDALGEAYRNADDPLHGYLRSLERQAEAEARLYVPMRQRLELLRQSATAAEAQARIQLAPLGMTPGTPEYEQALRRILDLTGRIADEQARLAGTDTFGQEVRALTQALITGDEAAKRLFDTIADLPARLAANTRQLQSTLSVLRASSSNLEVAARQQLQPLVDQGLLQQESELYNQTLSQTLELLRSIAAERANLAGGTQLDQEIRALTQALIAGDEAARRLFDVVRETPATLAAGTRQLEERLQLLRESVNRHDQIARLQLEELVTQGALIRGSEEYNTIVARRASILRASATEERRIAFATSGRLTIFERENLRLEQQVQLFRFGSEEMAIQNRLLQIRIAAIQAQQPLDEQQTRQIETRMRQLQQLQNITSTVNEAMTTVFSSLADQIAEFAATGKMNMKDFADQVIRQLVRIALQAMVIRPLLNAISGYTNSLFGEALSPGSTTTPINLGKNASGGSFTVPGRNRGDQPYLIGLSGGERVNVTPSGQGDSAGKVTVINNIQSSKDFEVNQTEREGPDGQRIVEQTFTEVMRRIGRGDGDNTFGARFGMRPRTVQR